MLRATGSLTGTNSLPGLGLRSHSPLTTCQELLNDIFASLLQMTSWLASPAPPPPSNWKQTTLMSKELLNYFLPERSQNIKHVLKSCTIPWRNFMIWLLLLALLLGWGSLESAPNNEAMLFLAFPFNGDKTVHVSIFRLCSSGTMDMQKRKPQCQHGTSRAK